MATVIFFELTNESRIPENRGELELAGVPQFGEKVVIDIDSIGYIFKVQDVHYADGNRVDVFGIRISTITEYNGAKTYEGGTGIMIM